MDVDKLKNVCLVASENKVTREVFDYIISVLNACDDRDVAVGSHCGMSVDYETFTKHPSKGDGGYLVFYANHSVVGCDTEPKVGVWVDNNTQNKRRVDLSYIMDVIGPFQPVYEIY